MNIGKLDRQISILEPVYTTNSLGEKKRSYQLFKKVWASKQEQKGSEVFQADQLTAIATAVFVIRYIEGIREDMIIEDNGQKFDVKGLHEIQRRKGCQIVAERKDDNVL